MELQLKYHSFLPRSWGFHKLFKKKKKPKKQQQKKNNLLKFLGGKKNKTHTELNWRHNCSSMPAALHHPESLRPGPKDRGQSSIAPLGASRKLRGRRQRDEARPYVANMVLGAAHLVPSCALQLTSAPYSRRCRTMLSQPLAQASCRAQ